MDLKDYIRSIKDYPKKGILFRDITTLIKNETAFEETINQIVERSKKFQVDKIAAIESRGFVFASAVSYILKKPFIMLRKKNKLPPYQRFISLILTGENERKLEKEAFDFKNFIESKINGRILGPVNAPLFRLKKKFRIRFLIRGSKSMKMQSSLAKIIPRYKFSSGIKLSVDVDPINFN